MRASVEQIHGVPPSSCCVTGVPWPEKSVIFQALDLVTHVVFHVEHSRGTIRCVDDIIIYYISRLLLPNAEVEGNTFTS